MAHAQLSPSGWGRWSVCPGSVAACAGLPDSTSPYADEGTAAHTILERVLQGRYTIFGLSTFSAAQFVGERVNVADEGEEPRLVTVDDAMAEHVDTVADYVERRRQEMAAAGTHNGFPGPVLVNAERQVSPQWALGTHDCAGTADVILVSDHEVEVIDLKYGRGVVVEPGTHEDPNGQMMLYLLGALGEWRPRPDQDQTYRVTVAQPRAPHEAGPIRSLMGITPADTTDFVERVTRAIAAVEKTPDLRVASEHGCRFCKARPTCKVHAQWALQSIGAPSDLDRATFLDEVTAFSTTPPGDLTPEAIVKLLDAADLVRGFLTAVEEWAHGQLTKGTAPSALSAAYKLVEGRSQRRWVEGNDDSIASALTRIRWKDPVTEKTTGLGKRDVYEEKLRSPTQIEGLLKKAAKGASGAITATHWEAFNRLVTKPEGRMQLAHITDSRPAAGAKDPAVMFGGDVPAAPPAFNATQFTSEEHHHE